MNLTHLIGVDPGPVVGAVLISLPDLEIEAAHITPGGLWALLDGWHISYPLAGVAAERFVIGPRAARSNAPQAGTDARKVLGTLERWASVAHVPYVERSAAEVKPWATDHRLAAAGLLEPLKNMRHARDAARHALFSAVRDFGLPDPLSRKAGAR